MRRLNQKGSVMIMFTLGFALLGTFVGFALDFGRAYLERSRISRLVDGASLAAAKALKGQTGFEDEATRAACDSMVMNGAPVAMSGTGVCAATTGAPFNVILEFLDVSVAGGPPIKHVQVTGFEPVATTFLRFLGWMVPGDFSKIDVAVGAQAAPERPVDLMLVLDRSGSMSINGGQKINALKTTVNEFLDNNFTGNDRVGMVSFATRGCGNTSGGDFSGPNCSPDVSLDFATSSHINTLKSKVSGLDAGGATNTMEALRTARPPIAQAFNDPDRERTRKAVLLVTDGKPTALRRDNDSDCKSDPQTDAPLPSPGDSGNFPQGCIHIATADNGDRMGRQTLNGSPAGTIFGATLFQHAVACTRSLSTCNSGTNGAMYEANVLRNCGYSNSSCTAGGAHDVIVFAIGIGAVVANDANSSFDRNAKCLLARIANATDVMNTGNNTIETISSVCSTPPVTYPDGDSYADLQDSWPCGAGPCINASQEKGKVYIIDQNGNIEAQMQQVFKEIAALLKLRLTA